MNNSPTDCHSRREGRRRGLHPRNPLSSKPVHAWVTNLYRSCSAASPVLSPPRAPGSRLAGHRLLALDGTCLDLPATPANNEHFARLPSSRGDQSTFPQARMFAVAECGTHAVFNAAIGPCRTPECKLDADLTKDSKRGNCCSPIKASTDSTCGPATASGSDLLWRVDSPLPPRHLDDRS